ncbi:MAG: universal stress protein [Comamonadaceae bacterium]|nr:universal stress protein [Comamonadaceae bacterium]
MTKLLLPVDGSPCSRRAAEFAVRLAGDRAKRRGPAAERAVARHGVGGLRLRHRRDGEPDPREGRTRGHQGAREVLDAAGVPCEEHLLVGEPAEIIAQVAAQEGVEGIVMGTRGMGLVKSLMLGSVATKVIHLVEVPVTLVK